MRKSRYTAYKEGRERITPLTQTLTEILSDFGYLTTKQIYQLLDYHENTLQKAIRGAKDARMIEAVQVPINRVYPEKLWGTAPDILRVTKKMAKELGAKYIPDLPKLRLRHNLKVRDVLVWAQKTTVAQPVHLTWRLLDTGYQGVYPDAHLDFLLPNPYESHPDRRTVHMVGLLEVDMGTERELAWKQKIEGYTKAFATGDLTEWVGQENARILVVCETYPRMHNLNNWVAKYDKENYPSYWFTTFEYLTDYDLRTCRWYNRGFLKPLPSNQQGEILL